MSGYGAPYEPPLTPAERAKFAEVIRSTPCPLCGAPAGRPCRFPARKFQPSTVKLAPCSARIAAAEQTEGT